MRKKQISKDNVKAQTALLETREKEYDLTLKELKDLEEMYVVFFSNVRPHTGSSSEEVHST